MTMRWGPLVWMVICTGAPSFGCAVDSEDSGLSGGGDGAGTIGTGTGAGAATEGDEGAGDASGVGDSGAADSGGSSTPKLDVGGPDSGDSGECVEGNCTGCNAVDLLFVIDNSVSMDEVQVALGQAFPGFAQAIIDALPPSTSLHVAVTSTEMGFSSGGSTTNCAATGDGNLPQDAFYVTPEDESTGVNGAQGRLYEALGRHYFEIDTDAPPEQVAELEAWFAEASHIGDSGSQIEMSAAAAGWAVDPANAATNAGFIRDEGAVLVIFFVQDEPDQTPPDVAEDLIARIGNAKAGCGGTECVVGGGFVNETCLPQVALGTMLDAFGAPSVLQSLPFGDGVDPSAFAPLLEDTLAQVIAQKCEQIPPPG